MIRYTFSFDEETTLEFEVDEQADASVEASSEPFPSWVHLGRSQCPICPLSTGERKTCPAALSIKPFVEAFSRRLSFETVHVVVERDGTTFSATTPIQQAVRSLLGLVLALSSCPILMKLRPMAQLHVPLCGADHTAFRFLGMYLIAQYIRKNQGKEPDWDAAGLIQLIDDIHTVNKHLTDRIRAVSRKDAAVNAVILLDFLADGVQWSTEESVDVLRPLFAPYSDGPPEN